MSVGTRSPLQWDAGREVPEGQPETRNAHQYLESLCQLAEESLMVQRHLLAAMAALNEGTALFSGGEERIASVTVEDMAKGPPKVTSKSYAERPLTRALVDQHLDAHGYAHRQAEAMAMVGWQATVDGLVEKAAS